MMKKCLECEVVKPTSDFWRRKSGPRAGDYYTECKSCRSDKAKKWRREHKDQVAQRNREWSAKHPGYTSRLEHRKGKTRPLSEAKDTGVYLGVYIAERALSKFFNNIIRMPFRNPGYDFLCGRGFKIDVKSSCIIKQPGRSDAWTFHIQKNTVADYFLCLAFDNRESLEPLHVWLVPGKDVNEKSCIHLSKTRLSKWTDYEKPLDRVVVCCDQIKRQEGLR